MPSLFDMMMGASPNVSQVDPSDPTGAYLGNMIDRNTAAQYQSALNQQRLLNFSAALGQASAPQVGKPVTFGGAMSAALGAVAGVPDQFTGTTLKAAQTANQIADSTFRKLQGVQLGYQIQNMPGAFQALDAMNKSLANKGGQGGQGGQADQAGGQPGQGQGQGGGTVGAPQSLSGKLDLSTPNGLVAKFESGGNYNIGFGGADLSGAKVDDYGFPIWDGKQGPAGISHAAGAYQFEPKTWRAYAGPLGIHDFSPESQDKVFAAAFNAEGFKPWAPYNSNIAAGLQRGLGQGPLSFASSGSQGSGGSQAQAQAPEAGGADEGAGQGNATIVAQNGKTYSLTPDQSDQYYGIKNFRQQQQYLAGLDNAPQAPAAPASVGSSLMASQAPLLAAQGAGSPANSVLARLAQGANPQAPQPIPTANPAAAPANLMPAGPAPGPVPGPAPGIAPASAPGPAPAPGGATGPQTMPGVMPRLAQAPQYGPTGPPAMAGIPQNLIPSPNPMARVGGSNTPMAGRVPMDVAPTQFNTSNYGGITPDQIQAARNTVSAFQKAGMMQQLPEYVKDLAKMDIAVAQKKAEAWATAGPTILEQNTKPNTFRAGGAVGYGGDITQTVPQLVEGQNPQGQPEHFYAQPPLPGQAGQQPQASPVAPPGVPGGGNVPAGTQGAPGPQQAPAPSNAMVPGGRGPALITGQGKPNPVEQANPYSVYPTQVGQGPGQSEDLVVAPDAGHPYTFKVPALAKALPMPMNPERQKAIIEQNSKILEQQSTQSDAVERGIQQTLVLRDVLSATQSGKWAQEQADINAKLKAVNLPPIFDTDPAKAQIVGKEALNGVFTFLSDNGVKRITNMEVTGAQKANPSIDLQPEANAELLSNNLGQMFYHQALGRTMRLAQQQGWVNLKDVQDAFNETNHVYGKDGFVTQARSVVGDLRGTGNNQGNAGQNPAMQQFPNATPEKPPEGFSNARKAPDGNWYVPNPNGGGYMRLVPRQ